MKLGVSFNVFNGEELLEDALVNIKPYADYICVIYQDISNFGTNEKDLSGMLEELKQKKLIDKYILYTPDFTFEGVEDWKKDVMDRTYYGSHNEIRKRNIGLGECRKEGCTHLLDMDTDEFYRKSQMENAMDMVEVGGYDASFCKLKTYYKYPSAQMVPDEEYYVPFIYKIKPKNKFEPTENADFPVYCDGKRRIKNVYPYVFPRDELEMHHFSYVRKDEISLRSKFENCSSIINFPKERVEELVGCWNNLKEEDIGKDNIIVEQGKQEKFTTKRVDNQFNIKL